MRFISALGIIIFIIIFVIAHDGVKAIDAEVVNTANEVLKTGTEFLSHIDAFISPIKAFEKIAGFMGNLGPAAMAVSAILSIVTMFLPKEDSPELKAIKAGFEKVNNKLDIITSKIGNLESVIELTGAKSSFADSLTAITSNYETLTLARNTNNKDTYRLFAKKYDNTFNLATDKIYDTMTGSFGSLGFDIVNIYRVNIKCNPALLSQFCTKGMQLIVKGLDLEGAYLGYNNFSDQAKITSQTWKAKMSTLTKHCSDKIRDCEANWETYAKQQFRDTHKSIGGDNQAFANRLAKDMENVVPQRSWLSVVYDDAWGFGPHTISTAYSWDNLWHTKDHCATVVSTDKRPTLTGQDFNNLVATIEKQKGIAQRVNNCKYKFNWLMVGQTYKGKHASTIVGIIGQAFSGAVIYAIQMNYKPGVAVTGNTLHVTTLKWPCESTPFKLIIFK